MAEKLETLRSDIMGILIGGWEIKILNDMFPGMASVQEAATSYESLLIRNIEEMPVSVLLEPFREMTGEMLDYYEAIAVEHEGYKVARMAREARKWKMEKTA